VVGGESGRVSARRVGGSVMVAQGQRSGVVAGIGRLGVGADMAAPQWSAVRLWVWLRGVRDLPPWGIP
jgi:hypothetical protein